MDSKRYSNCIVDFEQKFVINTTKGNIVHFNFDDMWCITSGKATKHPIRYCSNKKKLLRWISGSWKVFEKQDQEAVEELFQYEIEGLLLNEDNND